MTKMNKYNLDGKNIGTVEADKSITNCVANSQSIKDYITAMRKNARQWSASTLGRSEVKHTTKKSVRQKGTGGARHGSTVAPQYRGGGIVFGPKPKFDQHTRINRKERKAAIRCILSEKINNERTHIIESTSIEKPQTKTMAAFLKNVGLTRRVLFLGESQTETVTTEDKTAIVTVKNDKHVNFAKSIKNLPKINFSLAKNVNGYDLMLADDIVMTEEALNELKAWLA